MRIKAIPTRYAGVQFRSRLEARWAAYFDLIGAKWDYEPLDFDGWIPDFILPDLIECPILLEVKPMFTDWHEEMCTMVKAVEAAGWRETSFDMYQTTIEKDRILAYLVLGHTPLELYAFHPHDEAAWKEAGNIVQWRSPRKRAAKRR